MTYRTSIFDFFDDGGKILKSMVTDPSDLPEFVKTASSASQDDPSNMFALVMVEDGEPLKKFATADAGNTWLSSLYFSVTKDRLPREAQKVAAANLLMACEHYEIEPTRDIVELSGDHLPTTNVVDVSGASLPTVKVANDIADDEYALHLEDGTGVYPINSAAAVKAADQYFSQNHAAFQPRQRREYAVKVAAAAGKAGLSISDEILKYAGDGYSSGLTGHLDVRYHHLVAEDASGEIKEELSKLAHSRSSLSPDDFASRLHQFDRDSGLDRLWDSEIADPWYATFNMLKTAKGVYPGSTYHEDVAGHRVTEEDLNALAEDYKALVDFFGEAAAKSFASDPVKIFKSMPLPQKRMVARWATDANSTGMR